MFLAKYFLVLMQKCALKKCRKIPLMQRNSINAEKFHECNKIH
jgi:hypothetical protein